MPPARRRPDSPPPHRRRGPGRPRGRNVPALSLEAVVEVAIALLDEAGESALTFRSLAARLGAGVGSVYWYVSSKDELLDRATDAVMGELLARTESLTGTVGDPIATLRELSIALFGAMEAHPWLAAYLMRDISIQANSLRVYERFGQQVLRLSLAPKESFHAVSAIINYVTGVGAEMGQAPDRAGGVLLTELDRQAFLEGSADIWRATDPADFPFLHAVADEFADHKDEDQFTSGLDLMLAGLRLQASA